MNGRRKPMGRPKGETTKRRMANALMAEGVQPFEAMTKAGYAYPGREVKRQAASVAEARGADPIETLLNIARYGAPADVVSACEALLQMPVDPTASDSYTHTIFVVPYIGPPRVHISEDDFEAA